MNPNIPQQQIKTRRALLVFLKGVAPPMVLYVDDIDTAFAQVKKIITNADPKAPKLVEKIGKGPLKKLAVLDTEIAGAAIQEEPAI